MSFCDRSSAPPPRPSCPPPWRPGWLPRMRRASIKIGEVNSYKAQPAFLEPYKKGMELAVDEINAAGGVNGKKLELISRDDNAQPRRRGARRRGAGVAREGRRAGRHLPVATSAWR